MNDHHNHDIFPLTSADTASLAICPFPTGEFDFEFLASFSGIDPSIGYVLGSNGQHPANFFMFVFFFAFFYLGASGMSEDKQDSSQQTHPHRRAYLIRSASAHGS